MSRTLDAVLSSWPVDPWTVAAIVLTGIVYVRGWRALRRGSNRWQPRHLVCFLSGLAAVFLAVASPIEPFSGLFLQVHMVQHLLLMMVAPPLIWLGEPALPLLRGLPIVVQRHALGPFLRSAGVGRFFRFLTHPVTAWILFVGTTWLWHTPALFDGALRSEALHRLEHVCFLGTALLFWWPVVLPHPASPTWSRWLVLPYLLLADVQNTVLSALLTFSDRVLYPHYAEVPRLGGVSALDDQSAAGVLMWVPGSLVYMVPLGVIACRLLFGAPASERRKPLARPARIALPVVSATPPDLLRAPLLGRFLRWRHARLALQLPLLLLAVVIVFDGLCGPQVSPLNLAGVLPWIHWRGLLVMGLLVAGNVFCLACPFMLPRTIARKWWTPGRRWPRWLRGKWLAAGLLVLFFWAYEAFALWDSPWLTAWIIVGYFVAAFVVDAFFHGAAFCKYVCPVGQFNFVQSLVSPVEVAVRDPAVCRTCATHDCLRGNADGPGCELHLFQPRKAGNLDCTFCLDCVHACPHDNVGLLAAVPGAALWQDRPRSSVGRFVRRPDLAALVLVLVFAAFVNAAGMVAPVVEWQDRLTADLGLSGPRPVLTACFALGLLVLPVLLVGTAATLGRWWSGETEGLLAAATRYSFALVPLGAGMWLAHYSFHLLASGAGLVAVHRFTADMGLSLLAEPQMICCSCAAPPGWLLRLEIVFLEAGLLLSLYTAYRISRGRHVRTADALKVLAPWAALIVLLFVAGVWLVFQPMQMRGAAPLG